MVLLTLASRGGKPSAHVFESIPLRLLAPGTGKKLVNSIRKLENT